MCLLVKLKAAPGPPTPFLKKFAENHVFLIYFFFTYLGHLDKTIMDHKKSSRLSDKIYNAVDEFLLARDLPQLNSASVHSRKRPQEENIEPDDLDGQPMIKKTKTEADSASEGNGNGSLAPAVPMSAQQIRAMMANTMKQIEERKASIAALQQGIKCISRMINYC